VGYVRTMLNGGALTLNPAPTNSAFDVGVDGSVTVLGAKSIAAKPMSSAELANLKTAASDTPAVRKALDQVWMQLGQQDLSVLLSSLTPKTGSAISPGLLPEGVNSAADLGTLLGTLAAASVSRKL